MEGYLPPPRGHCPSPHSQLTAVSAESPTLPNMRFGAALSLLTTLSVISAITIASPLVSPIKPRHRSLQSRALVVGNVCVNLDLDYKFEAANDDDEDEEFVSDLHSAFATWLTYGASTSSQSRRSFVCVEKMHCSPLSLAPTYVLPWTPCQTSSGTS